MRGLRSPNIYIEIDRRVAAKNINKKVERGELGRKTKHGFFIIKPRLTRLRLSCLITCASAFDP